MSFYDGFNQVKVVSSSSTRLLTVGINVLALDSATAVLRTQNVTHKNVVSIVNGAIVLNPTTPLGIFYAIHVDGLSAQDRSSISVFGLCRDGVRDSEENNLFDIVDDKCIYSGYISVPNGLATINPYIVINAPNTITFSTSIVFYLAGLKTSDLEVVRKNPVDIKVNNLFEFPNNSIQTLLAGVQTPLNIFKNLIKTGAGVSLFRYIISNYDQNWIKLAPLVIEDHLNFILSVEVEMKVLVGLNQKSEVCFDFFKNNTIFDTKTIVVDLLADPLYVDRLAGPVTTFYLDSHSPLMKFYPSAVITQKIFLESSILLFKSDNFTTIEVKTTSTTNATLNLIKSCFIGVR